MPLLSLSLSLSLSRKAWRYMLYSPALPIAKSLGMVNTLPISPSMQPVSGDDLLPETRQRAEESDETESFNEEECLFLENDDSDDEWHQGAFAHYSKLAAKPNAVRHRRPNSVHFHHEHDNSDALNVLHDSSNVYHIRPHSKKCHESLLFSSYDERRSALHSGAASPDSKATILRRTRKVKKSSLSVRESLLAEAWERKRELMLSEELANFKESASPELLGRSSSDCGKVSAANVHGLSRARSLTDDDFEELRGCIDLGFRFDQSSVADLCETLPALEVYCAVAQSLQESPILNSPVRRSPTRCSSPSPSTKSTRCSSPSPTPSWRVASPGDDPKDVKGRLRHWAQAVACDAKLFH